MPRASFNYLRVSWVQGAELVKCDEIHHLSFSLEGWMVPANRYPRGRGLAASVLGGFLDDISVLGLGGIQASTILRANLHTLDDT